MSWLPLQTWGGDLSVQYSSDWAVIFVTVFSVAMIAIGALAARSQESEEDYFVAGRNIGIVAIALSGFAAIQSGWGIVGSPGTIYSTGFEYFAVSMFIPFGFVIAYWLLARKMRTLGTLKNAITAPDAMYYRFQDDRVRLLGAISVFLGSMGYLASQYAALGIIGALILPVGFFEALIIGLVVVGIYTVIGGILAAVWSDAIQGVMMILGGALTAYYIFVNYPGGFGGMVQTLETEVPQFFNSALLGQDAILGIGFPLSVFVLVLTVVGQPQLTTKFYMVRRVSMLKWGAFISGFGYLMTTLYWWAGPFMRAGAAQLGINVPTPDASLPIGLVEFAPSIVTAFVLTAIIAAIMSTSNAFLNLGASAVTHDFIQEYMGRDLTNSQQVTYGRVVTVLILVVAFAIAATFPGLIFVLGAAGWALFASVMVPCVAVAYNWKGATTEGALWGGGVGLGLVIFLAYAPNYLGFSLPYGILGGQLAQVIGFIVFVAVSYVTSTSTYEDLDDDVQDVLDIGRLKEGSIHRGVAADGGENTEDD